MQDNLQTGLQDHWPDHLENNPSFGKDSPSFVGNAGLPADSRGGMQRPFPSAEPTFMCTQFFCLERFLLWWQGVRAFVRLRRRPLLSTRPQGSPCIRPYLPQWMRARLHAQCNGRPSASEPRQDDHAR